MSLAGIPCSAHADHERLDDPKTRVEGGIEYMGQHTPELSRPVLAACLPKKMGVLVIARVQHEQGILSLGTLRPLSSDSCWAVNGRIRGPVAGPAQAGPSDPGVIRRFPQSSKPKRKEENAQ